ncbi:MAG: hypothetical protein PHV59_01130 [Victivallales bacterium]|nr:hypothetical protein [Victivallales bacterium]
MFNLAFIGLDSSHSVVFAELIQGRTKLATKLRVISCMRFPSAFQSESDQDARQKKLEALGVKVTRSFAEAVKGVDGIMLEINDPALHLEYFGYAAKLGLPVYIDKPLADNLENGCRIYELAKMKNLPVWSSSPLRFTPELRDCAAKANYPKFCNVFGPLAEAARGSSLVWYGIHTFEMLMLLMGRGAESVFAREDIGGVVAIVNYNEGRRGIAECNNKPCKYGGQAHNNELLVPYLIAGSPYPYLMTALEKFFIEGIIPVSFEETLEIQAILEAAVISLKSNKTETILQTVK